MSVVPLVTLSRVVLHFFTVKEKSYDRDLQHYHCSFFRWEIHSARPTTVLEGQTCTRDRQSEVENGSTVNEYELQTATVPKAIHS